MAGQLQLRGGTTLQHSTFTGVAKEITVDTDKDVVVVHDGTTVGGIPMARESVVATLQSEVTAIDGVVDEVVADLNAVHIDRADKYLAAQAVANMVYTDGKLTKVQYNNATDAEREVLAYDGTGKLITVQHYAASTLRGTTTLSYTDGKLVSAIYAGV